MQGNSKIIVDICKAHSRLSVPDIKGAPVIIFEYFKIVDGDTAERRHQCQKAGTRCVRISPATNMQDVSVVKLVKTDPYGRKSVIVTRVAAPSKEIEKEYHRVARKLPKVDETPSRVRELIQKFLARRDAVLEL